MAISFRSQVENWWLIGLGGLLSVLFGVVLGFLPEAGLLTPVWLADVAEYVQRQKSGLA